MAIKITNSILTDVIVDTCDIENLCADEVLDNFISQKAAGQQGGNGVITIPTIGVQNPQAGYIVEGQTTVRLQNDSITSYETSQIQPQTSTDNLFGKKNLFISSDIIANTYATFVSLNPLKNNDNFSSFDILRGRLGAYWSLGENQELTYLRFNEEVRKQSVIDYDPKSLEITGYFQNNLKVIPTTSSFAFGTMLERYNIEFKEQFFKDTQGNLSIKLINSFAFGGAYTGSIEGVDDSVEIRYTATLPLNLSNADINFISYLPYSKKELQQTSVPVSSLTYDVVSDYVFYVKEYENFLSRTDIDETLLPNLYVLEANLKLENPTQQLQNEFDLKKGKQYYEDFHIGFKKLIPEEKQEKQKRFKNFLFSSREVKQISTYLEKKFVHPMNVHIKFSADKTAQLSSILDIANLKEKVANSIVNKIKANDLEEKVFYKQSVESAKTTPIGNLEIFKQESEETLRYINLEIIIDEIRKGESSFDYDNCFYFGNKEDLEKLNQTNENKFLDTLYYSIFCGKMGDFLNQKTRTYRAILEGAQSYTETFMYRIAKYRGINTSIEPIQNIYFINDGNLDVIDYVDTQVKYDEEYTYVVYAYNLIVGNEYTYTNRNNTDIINIKRIDLKNKPFLIMAEIPLITKQTRVYDSPPAPPEVDIVSYKDIDNKILIMFNSSANTYRASPVLLEQKDTDIYKKISEKQEVEFGDLLEFSTDDPVSYYEVYRIEQRPTKYLDFAGNLLTTVDTRTPTQEMQQASSAALVDSVAPNRKYYYMFRSVDIHDKPSNPTEAYQVEIVNEKGTIFALVDVIELKQENRKTTKKSFKRFVQLIPSTLQTILNENSENYANAKTANDVINSVSLGIVDNPVWNKKFKVRFVSKQTGKVLDFNLKFDFVAKK